jgi:hypothetical protein
MLPSLNFSQLDFVKPSSGFHPVTWERVIQGSQKGEVINLCMTPNCPHPFSDFYFDEILFLQQQNWGLFSLCNLANFP